LPDAPSHSGLSTALWPTCNDGSLLLIARAWRFAVAPKPPPATFSPAPQSMCFNPA